MPTVATCSSGITAGSSSASASARLRITVRCSSGASNVPPLRFARSTRSGPFSGLPIGGQYLFGQAVELVLGNIRRYEGLALAAVAAVGSLAVPARGRRESTECWVLSGPRFAQHLAARHSALSTISSRHPDRAHGSRHSRYMVPATSRPNGTIMALSPNRPTASGRTRPANRMDILVEASAPRSVSCAHQQVTAVPQQGVHRRQRNPPIAPISMA
jgi:hypothetical protein